MKDQVTIAMADADAIRQKQLQGEVDNSDLSNRNAELEHKTNLLNDEINRLYDQLD